MATTQAMKDHLRAKGLPSSVLYRLCETVYKDAAFVVIGVRQGYAIFIGHSTCQIDAFRLKKAARVLDKTLESVIVQPINHDLDEPSTFQKGR